VNVPLYIHGRTDVGRQRERNEDCFGVEHRGTHSHLLIVCDGMGGHGGGDIASRIAVDTIIAQLSGAALREPPAAIYQALRTANVEVLTAARGSHDPAMGTTAVVAWIEERSCWVGWVGDSRFYHFRGGGLFQNSVDHTRVQRMIELGLLTPSQAREHPDAHILTQAIGGGDASDVQPSAWNEPEELRDGDVLLLCSDGLYDLIEDSELYPLIEGRSYQEAVDTLIGVANQRGGTDNITVVLCVVGQPVVPHIGQASASAQGTPRPGGGGSGGGGGSWWRSLLIGIPLVGALALATLAVLGGAGLWVVLPEAAPEADLSPGSAQTSPALSPPPPALDASAPPVVVPDGSDTDELAAIGGSVE
jgi:protein phosphatase